MLEVVSHASEDSPAAVHLWNRGAIKSVMHFGA